jgi:hypothetical protein
VLVKTVISSMNLLITKTILNLYDLLTRMRMCTMGSQIYYQIIFYEDYAGVDSSDDVVAVLLSDVDP